MQNSAAEPKKPDLSFGGATAIVSLKQLDELRTRAASSEESSEARDWYALVAGNQKGPLTIGELKVMTDGHEIDAHTFVWRTGMEDWQRMADVDELRELAPLLAPRPAEVQTLPTRMMDASAIIKQLELSEGDETLESTEIFDPNRSNRVVNQGAPQDDISAHSESPTVASSASSPFESPVSASDEPTNILSTRDLEGGFDGPTNQRGFAVPLTETTEPGRSVGSVHTEHTELFNLDDLAAASRVEEPTDPGEDARSVVPPAGNSFTDIEETPAVPAEVIESDSNGPGSKSDFDAPPGEQTRVFMATAGIFKRRRRNMFSAILGTVVVTALVTVVGLDFAGVYTIPGMGIAYELTGFEDPNTDRQIQRKTRALKSATDPEKRKKLQQQLLGLNQPDRKSTTRKPKRVLPKQQQGIDDTTNLDAGQKGLVENLFTDKRKSSETPVLRPPDKIQTQVDLPDGLTSEAIQRVIAEKQSSMKLCLTEAARSGQSLRGRMEVQITIAPTGKVTEALINSPKYRGSPMGTCTVKRARSWKFPRFNGAPATVVFPYVLEVGF